ncbi:hypothetical protein NPIL_71621, partial [Nephila pilipes]
SGKLVQLRIASITETEQKIRWKKKLQEEGASRFFTYPEFGHNPSAIIGISKYKIDQRTRLEVVEIKFEGVLNSDTRFK